MLSDCRHDSALGFVIDGHRTSLASDSPILHLRILNDLLKSVLVLGPNLVQMAVITHLTKRQIPLLLLDLLLTLFYHKLMLQVLNGLVDELLDVQILIRLSHFDLGRCCHADAEGLAIILRLRLRLVLLRCSLGKHHTLVSLLEIVDMFLHFTLMLQIEHIVFLLTQLRSRSSSHSLAAEGARVIFV